MRIRHAFITLFAILNFQNVVIAASAEIVDVRKIWDAGDHNAFTDLIRWHDRWWCSFRESHAHIGGEGKIRLIASNDGQTWESAALIEEKEVDLRDPKLSITPDRRLMIVAGGSIYNGTTTLKGRQPRVMFSADGRTWTDPQKVLSDGDWLWRVTWHEGTAYGVSYLAPTDKSKWAINLHSSTDGMKWELLCPLNVDAQPNETTLRFDSHGDMLALVRREAGKGYFGSAKPPFKQWTWHELNDRLGGPNFIEIPDGSLIAGTRAYGAKTTTIIARLTPTTLETLLTVPSGGDTSYPGMVWYENVLWFSYYSSHERKTSIYLAKIKIQ